MNLLNLLAPNAWGPPASRTPANNGVPGVGVSTPCGPVVPGDTRFRTRFVGIVDAWNAFYSGDGTVSSPIVAGFTNPRQSTVSQLGWGLHTVRGGIDPGDLRFRPRVVAVVET